MLRKFFDVFKYILDLKHEVFVTYKQLLLRPNTQDYDWAFHPDSLFLSNYFVKMFEYLQVFWMKDKHLSLQAITTKA